MSKIARWLHNAKIRVKITCGFLLVALIAGFIGVIGIVGLNIVSGSYHLAYSESVAALQHMERISASFQEVRAGLFELLLIEGRAGKQARVDSLEGLRTVINENLTGYETLLAQYEAEETERQLFADLEAAIVAYGDQRREFMNGIAMDPARRGEALRFLGDGGTLHTLTLDLESAISSLVAYHQSHAQQQIHDNSTLALRNELIIVAGIAAGMILAVWIGLFIARSISRPIGQIVDVTDKLALGDVDVRIDIRSEDEIGQLAKSFGYMIDNIRQQAFAVERIADGDLTVSVAVRSGNDLLNQKLREMVAKNNRVLTDIVAAAEQVGTGAEQVSSGAQALAAGSTEQAASVEELSASIEKIAQQAQENAAIVNTSAGLLGAVDAEINEGNAHMAALTAAMGEIGTASGQIANITKVIEDIAFQTNILALNAAIEAARAGAAGKGFAVVADEVRSLAAKSAEAAKQTGHLIGASVATVDKGAQMTAQTVKILREIGVKSAQVTESFGRIEQSSAEQAGAIAQIRDGLSQVSSVVQTNAATAEENSATSEEMSAQAAALRHEVGGFKLAGDDTPSPARPNDQKRGAAAMTGPAYSTNKY